MILDSAVAHEAGKLRRILEWAVGLVHHDEVAGEEGDADGGHEAGALVVGLSLVAENQNLAPETRDTARSALNESLRNTLARWRIEHPGDAFEPNDLHRTAWRNSPEALESADAFDAHVASRANGLDPNAPNAERNPYYAALAANPGVAPWTARRAPHLDLLWWPPSGLDAKTIKRFAQEHGAARRWFMDTMWNVAYQGQPLYFGFCRLFLAHAAASRTLDSEMETAHTLEDMGKRELVNLLYSHGIHFLNDVSPRIQRRVIRAHHRLANSKGTAKAYREVLELFDHDNLDIRRQYLRKAPVSTGDALPTGVVWRALGARHNVDFRKNPGGGDDNSIRFDAPSSAGRPDPALFPSSAVNPEFQRLRIRRGYSTLFTSDLFLRDANGSVPLDGAPEDYALVLRVGRGTDSAAVGFPLGTSSGDISHHQQRDLPPAMLELFNAMPDRNEDPDPEWFADLALARLADWDAGDDWERAFVDGGHDISFLGVDVKEESWTAADAAGRSRNSNFEDMTRNDPLWIADRRELEDLEFDAVRAKYVTIESLTNHQAGLNSWNHLFNTLRWITLSAKDADPSFRVDTKLASGSVPVFSLLVAEKLLLDRLAGLDGSSRVAVWRGFATRLFDSDFSRERHGYDANPSVLWHTAHDLDHTHGIRKTVFNRLHLHPEPADANLPAGIFPPGTPHPHLRLVDVITLGNIVYAGVQLYDDMEGDYPSGHGPNFLSPENLSVIVRLWNGSSEGYLRINLLAGSREPYASTSVVAHGDALELIRDIPVFHADNPVHGHKASLALVRDWAPDVDPASAFREVAADPLLADPSATPPRGFSPTLLDTLDPGGGVELNTGNFAERTGYRTLEQIERIGNLEGVLDAIDSNLAALARIDARLKDRSLGWIALKDLARDRAKLFEVEAETPEESADDEEKTWSAWMAERVPELEWEPAEEEAVQDKLDEVVEVVDSVLRSPLHAKGHILSTNFTREALELLEMFKSYKDHIVTRNVGFTLGDAASDFPPKGDLLSMGRFEIPYDPVSGSPGERRVVGERRFPLATSRREDSPPDKRDVRDAWTAEGYVRTDDASFGDRHPLRIADGFAASLEGEDARSPEEELASFLEWWDGSFPADAAHRRFGPNRPTAWDSIRAGAPEPFIVFLRGLMRREGRRPSELVAEMRVSGGEPLVDAPAVSKRDVLAAILYRLSTGRTDRRTPRDDLPFLIPVRAEHLGLPNSVPADIPFANGSERSRFVEAPESQLFRLVGAYANGTNDGTGGALPARNAYGHFANVEFELGTLRSGQDDENALERIDARWMRTRTGTASRRRLPDSVFGNGYLHAFEFQIRDLRTRPNTAARFGEDEMRDYFSIDFSTRALADGRRSSARQGRSLRLPEDVLNDFGIAFQDPETGAAARTRIGWDHPHLTANRNSMPLLWQHRNPENHAYGTYRFMVDRIARLARGESVSLNLLLHKWSSPPELWDLWREGRTDSRYERDSGFRAGWKQVRFHWYAPSNAWVLTGIPWLGLGRLHDENITTHLRAVNGVMGIAHFIGSRSVVERLRDRDAVFVWRKSDGGSLVLRVSDASGVDDPETTDVVFQDRAVREFFFPGGVPTSPRSFDLLPIGRLNVSVYEGGATGPDFLEFDKKWKMHDSLRPENVRVFHRGTERRSAGEWMLFNYTLDPENTADRRDWLKIVSKPKREDSRSGGRLLSAVDDMFDALFRATDTRGWTPLPARDGFSAEISWSGLPATMTGWDAGVSHPGRNIEEPGYAVRGGRLSRVSNVPSEAGYRTIHFEGNVYNYDIYGLRVPTPIRFTRDMLEVRVHTDGRMFWLARDGRAVYPVSEDFVICEQHEATGEVFMVPVIAGWDRAAWVGAYFRKLDRVWAENGLEAGRHWFRKFLVKASAAEEWGVLKASDGRDALWRPWTRLKVRGGWWRAAFANGATGSAEAPIVSSGNHPLAARAVPGAELSTRHGVSYYDFDAYGSVVRGNIPNYRALPSWLEFDGTTLRTRAGMTSDGSSAVVLVEIKEVPGDGAKAPIQRSLIPLRIN